VHQAIALEVVWPVAVLSQVLEHALGRRGNQTRIRLEWTDSQQAVVRDRPLLGGNVQPSLIRIKGVHSTSFPATAAISRHG
jgi:hypothetical protein